MEIERKFLIDKLPKLDGYKSDVIAQAYISINPEVRVRKKGEKYFHTEKGEGAMVRSEHEWEIDEREYLDGVSKSEGRIIEKKRYYIPYQNYTIELDIYEGRHTGLIVCEVEFASESEANDFVAPKWFGKEITQDVAFRNKMLAQST